MYDRLNAQEGRERDKVSGDVGTCTPCSSSLPTSSPSSTLPCALRRESGGRKRGLDRRGKPA